MINRKIAHQINRIGFSSKLTPLQMISYRGFDRKPSSSPSKVKNALQKVDFFSMGFKKFLQNQALFTKYCEYTLPWGLPRRWRRRRRSVVSRGNEPYTRPRRRRRSVKSRGNDPYTRPTVSTAARPPCPLPRTQRILCELVLLAYSGALLLFQQRLDKQEKKIYDTQNDHHTKEISHNWFSSPLTSD